MGPGAIRRSLRRFLDRHFRRGGVFHKTRNDSDYVKRLEADPALVRVVNVGAGGRRLMERAINVDPWRVGPRDVRAFGEALPFLDGTIDCVICAAVLEHVPDPAAIVTEIHRVLRVGGTAYVEVPFLQPFHAAPHDYSRVTLPGLRRWMRAFDQIDSGVCSGPGSAVTWIVVDYVGFLFRNRTLSRLASYAAQVLLAPLKYLDARLMKKRPDAHYLASGVYFYGRKTAGRK